MFAPYCESHGSRVLLSTDSITAMVPGEHGLVAYFTCICGATGTWEPARAA